MTAEPHQQSEQCPHWVSSDNLKSDFRDQHIGRFYCNKLQQSEQEIREKVIQKFVYLIIEEMVYDDGDMYYKVNPEKYVNLLSELLSKQGGEP